jgi:EmrB/QacA subfamily drug resistance transporter
VTEPHGAQRVEAEPDPRRWKALAVCLVAGFMSLLDVSIVNVALPSIRTGLGASASDLQWVVSGYALAFGLLLVPSGRLGDARGRRAMFVVGVSVFTLSSVACGIAQGSLWLVVARLAQGLGGGLLNPQVSGVIQQMFTGRERGRAFGLLGSTIGLSTAVGPVVGGALISIFGVDSGWRWIFFVNAPIGVLAVFLALRLLPGPSPQQQRGRESLDPVGVALLGLSVLAFLLPLVEEQQWHGPAKWLLVAAGVLLLLAFGRWERSYAAQGRAPLVELGLLTIPSYARGVVLGLVYFSGFAGIFFVLAVFFQTGLGYSALESGLAVTPFALGSAAASAIGGRFVHRLGRPMVVAGLLTVCAGLVATDLVISHHGSGDLALWTALPLLVAGVGSGLVISPNITLTLADVPVRRAGTAGGVLQTGQRLGTAIGVAAVGSTFFRTLGSDRGDYRVAVSHGMRVATVITAVALVIGLLDGAATRRRARRVSAGDPEGTARR